MAKRWGLLGLLTLILYILNFFQNYTLGRPLAFAVLIVAIFFMTPLIYKYVYEEENYFALFGLLLVNSISVCVAANTLINVYVIPTEGLTFSNQYGAYFWAARYYSLAVGLYFAYVKIMVS